ncbi:hypothetical protein HYS47_00965 [Candidatus Woesearchaeota archaeon]|nr:hypothetical protein [Candidatus Woesearchaeota archaeon]
MVSGSRLLFEVRHKRISQEGRRYREGRAKVNPVGNQAVALAEKAGQRYGAAEEWELAGNAYWTVTENIGRDRNYVSIGSLKKAVVCYDKAGMKEKADQLRHQYHL